MTCRQTGHVRARETSHSRMQTEWKMCRHGRRVAVGDPPDAAEPEAAEASSEYLAKQIGQASFESEGERIELSNASCVVAVFNEGKIERGGISVPPQMSQLSCLDMPNVPDSKQSCPNLRAFRRRRVRVCRHPGAREAPSPRNRKWDPRHSSSPTDGRRSGTSPPTHLDERFDASSSTRTDSRNRKPLRGCPC